jgi:hypothetical protein
MTYAPEIVAGYVRTNWTDLSDNIRNVILRDVEEALHSSRHGYGRVHDEWRALRDWMAKEMAK